MRVMYGVGSGSWISCEIVGSISIGMGESSFL